MITGEQALSEILNRLPPSRIETAELSAALGRVCAEDVFSDIDLPPFDKSAMDGYAVRSEDLKRAPVELEVIGMIAAGQQANYELKPGKAIKIMTGAVVPSGADAVIMKENTEPLTNNIIKCLKGVRTGENISYKAEDLKDGQQVINAGTRITASAIGLLAAVGKHQISVYQNPRVAVLTTGAELVDITAKPQPAQIRNSNTYSLMAQFAEMGINAHSLGVVKDEPAKLAAKVNEGLQYDFLVLTGGVSVGDYDIVEDTLKKAGVEIIFNKVAIKPGKPFTFGINKHCLIFGLPGNPLATFVITEVFIRAALVGFTNCPAAKRPIIKAGISESINKPYERQQYLTGWLEQTETGLTVRPIAGHGSADLVSLKDANCFIIVPPNTTIPQGEMVECMLIK
ncbi:MAG: molybdopterin molybdotransferase MoeA [Planctomycetes bacterium]|nr:molybdopterin molybdotransferase MoeA [Planctomycetota bacterium]